MKTSKKADQLSGPARKEAWETFAEGARDLPPDATITGLIYAASMPSSFDSSTVLAAPAAPPDPVTLPDLPHLALSRVPSSSGSPSADAAGVDFEITGVLGEGGMGRVLLARQRSLQREVAIKVLKAAKASPEVVDTLLAEAVVTGSMEHPSVVPIHALGRDAEGQPILVMKRIEGFAWRDLAREPDHPGWASIAPDEGDRLDAHIEILMAVCNAAHFAHSRGIVHRDLKLHNVMIGAFGEVYLVDWGIALRAAKPGESPKEHGEDRRGHGALVGTPAYMAPEMVRGDLARIDARTDVYLLGATLHAVLTGAPRHTGETLLEVLVSARDSLPFDYDASVPAELAAICNRAMSADPEGRFPTALDLRRALASFRRHRGSIALSDEAAALLDEIRAHRAARASRGESAPPADERRVHARMTECRFGFTQALRAWKQNEAAREGLQGCLEAMIEHEIEQRDAEGARALYAELDQPRPELERRINALFAELGASAERDARLQAMERDLDLSIGARDQFVLVGILPVFGVMMLVLLYGVVDNAPSDRQLMTTPAVALALLLIGVAFTYRRLRTAISRRALSALVLLPAGTLLHRALLLYEGAEMAPVLTGDLVLGAVLTGAMAITLMPRMIWISAVLVLGAIAIAILPHLAVALFAGTATASFALILLVWVRTTRS